MSEEVWLPGKSWRYVPAQRGSDRSELHPGNKHETQFTELQRHRSGCLQGDIMLLFIAPDRREIFVLGSHWRGETESLGLRLPAAHCC